MNSAITEATYVEKYSSDFDLETTRSYFCSYCATYVI